MACDWEKNDDKKKNEQNCRITIEDSIVVLICGDVDIDKLRESLDAVVKAKGKKVYSSKEE